MKIRLAQKEDVGAITEIYNSSVPLQNATADLCPVSVEEKMRWFKEHDLNTHPIFVLEKDHTLAGWISLSEYRCGRAALKQTAEVSYYVHPDFKKQGIASQLMEHIISLCPALGIKNIFGIILETNEASIGLMKKFGFAQWAHLPNVADFNGKEVGHVYYGKRVGD